LEGAKVNELLPDKDKRNEVIKQKILPVIKNKISERQARNA
jgi:hypothetical protein